MTPVKLPRGARIDSKTGAILFSPTPKDKVEELKNMVSILQKELASCQEQIQKLNDRVQQLEQAERG